LEVISDKALQEAQTFVKVIGHLQISSYVYIQFPGEEKKNIQVLKLDLLYLSVDYYLV